MSQSIDIYGWPVRLGVMPSIVHMAAIMTAAAEGKPIIWRQVVNPSNHGKVVGLEGCTWNWHHIDFRVDPTSKPLAPARPFAAGDYVVSTYAPLTGITPGAVYQVAEVLVNKPWSKRLRMSNSALVICVGYFRHATDAEIATYLASKAPAFRIGDWVMMDDGVVAQIVALGGHSDISCPIVSLRGIVNWHPVATLRHATAAEIASLDPLANGHNPSRLKVSQVGEGYRLMDIEEIEVRHLSNSPVSSHIERWHPGPIGAGWDRVTRGTRLDLTFRTDLSRAELAALIAPPAPKVKVKRALRPNDLPPLFWFRTRPIVGHLKPPEYLPTCIEERGIWINGDLVTFEQMVRLDHEYSANRRDWSPFYIEV